MTEEAFLNKNIAKILLISSSLLTIVALIFLNNTIPVTNYEVDIYSAAPLFWFFIILSNVIVILCMILQAQTKKYEFFWLSFSLLLLNNFIILTQPLMKGYWSYGSSDPWMHYKFTSTIITSGSFGQDYYPVTHLLFAGINEITTINIEDIMKFIPAYFSILFIVFNYFLGKEVFKIKEYVVIAVAVSSTFLLLYFQISTYPQGLSILLLPFIFYLFFKSSDPVFNYKVLFVLFVFLLPFFHPFVSFTFICCLFMAEIIRYLLNRKQHKFQFNNTTISMVLFFVWWSTFAVFTSGITKLNSWLFSEVASVPRTADVAFTSTLSLSDTILLFLKSYGSQLICTILAFISVFLIILAYKKGNKELNKLVVLSGLYIVCLISYFIIFLTQGTTSIGRLLGSNISTWALPLLVAFPLFLIIKNIKKEKLATLFVLLIISSTFIVSTLGLYRSPWIDQPNWHFTYHDFSVTNWEENYYFNSNVSGGRFVHIGLPIAGSRTPNNFNYLNHTSLSWFYPKDGLLIFGTYRQRLLTSNSELNQSALLLPWANKNFTSETANNLPYDLNLQNVYSNGDFDIYYVTKNK